MKVILFHEHMKSVKDINCVTKDEKLVFRGVRDALRTNEKLINFIETNRLGYTIGRIMETDDAPFAVYQCRDTGIERITYSVYNC